MENLELWLIGGLLMCFIVIPAFTFLLCVRRINRKWHIKKDGIALYLYGNDIVSIIPENMCELYCIALLPSLVCFGILLVIGSFCFIGLIFYPFASEHPKPFSVILLGAMFIAMITWKVSAYAKTELWQNRKKKISRTFQKVKQKIEGKICIKFENI